nr:hypothetical protein [uncultured Rhodoferax sp.]
MTASTPVWALSLERRWIESNVLCLWFASPFAPTDTPGGGTQLDVLALTL